MSDPTLITFPPSLDSELMRFLLAHYRVRHSENRHAFLIASLHTLWHGKTPVFPLLYSDSYRYTLPWQVLEHFEPSCPAERKLLPADGPERQQVDADWNAFNQQLAVQTTIFAYHHLLPHREIMIRPLSEGAPNWEVATVRRLYPVFSGLLGLLLRLSPERAEEALGNIRSALDLVDRRLADGRRFLTGGRYTLSDMVFAVTVAPMVFPPQYGGAIPSFEELPPGVKAAAEETRQRPSGQLALRIYREHR